MEILNDFNTTVRKALDEIDPKWESYKGLIICGSHNDEQDTSEFIEKISVQRMLKLPYLGICHGHQLAAREYARNVLKVNDKEVITKLPQLNVGLKNGETYWNNYEVVEGFEDVWEKADNFITCQYHPEYQSSKDKPHHLLVEFINKCKGNHG